VGGSGLTHRRLPCARGVACAQVASFVTTQRDYLNTQPQ
jgi:hypothetical protein